MDQPPLFLKQKEQREELSRHSPHTNILALTTRIEELEILVETLKWYIVEVSNKNL